MDFSFFEQLSDVDARAFLADYLAAGAAGFDELARLVDKQQGVALAYEPSSVSSAFVVVTADVATIRLPIDETVPEWISSTESYVAGHFGFTDGAARSLLNLSVYLGETIRRTAGNAVRWDVGRRGTAEQGQPVLDGFAHDLQMSSLLVTEHLVRRLIVDPARTADVDRAVSTWLGWLP